MVTLERHFNLETLLSAPNIAELLTEDERQHIGTQAILNYRQDLNSRRDWDKRMAEAMKMALQVTEPKNWPWTGSSNIKFPLITIAALQYHARAYPALISGTDIVRCRAIGPDPDGKRAAQAERISAHMSYQLLEEDEEWESEHDKTLIVQAIVGAFKKTYFCPTRLKNISCLVLPRDLVVPYYTESLKTAERIQHVFCLSNNDLYEMHARELFLKPKEIAEVPRELSEQEVAMNDRQGIRPGLDELLPYEIIESHTWLDLDGDGYLEPYILVVKHQTGELLRIVARYFEDGIQYIPGKEKKVQRIEPIHMFTKYPFIPSPDGGFYDLALGSLLSPLSASIDTSVNQLIDAGTLSNLGGGFLGRGVKIASGKYTFTPGEWKKTDSPGVSLKDNIVPLVTPEPSEALFKLVELLINYGERVIGSTEMTQGQNPGQNTPAQTAQTMVGESMKVLNGIYKRTYRAMRDEFRKIFALNQVYLPVSFTFENLQSGVVLDISKEDYDSGRFTIKPAADPEIMSQTVKVQQATALHTLASTSQGFDQYQVSKRLLKAWEIHSPEEVLPDPRGPNAQPPPPPDPKLEIAGMKSKVQMFKYQIDARMKALKMVKEAELTEAKIVELKAMAAKLMAEAGDLAKGKELEAIKLSLEALESQEQRLIDSAAYMRDLIPDLPEETVNGQTVTGPSSPVGPTELGGMEEAPLDTGVATALGAGA